MSTKTARPRGRPRKVDSLTSSAASSRPACEYTTFYFCLFYVGTLLPACKLSFKPLTMSYSASRRSSRFIDEASKAPTSLFAVDDDASSVSSFPEVSKLGQYVSAGNTKLKGRDSLSSVSTSNDNNEGSGYSTPATSAFATPSEFPTKSSNTRRGRRPAAMAESSTPAVNPVARAAALRNSSFSLNKPKNNGKRKRVPDSEEPEDVDDDEDNSPDAQLARALQEQEVSLRISYLQSWHFEP